MVNTFLSALGEYGWFGYIIVFIVALLETLPIIGIFFPGLVFIILAGALASQGYFSLPILFLVVVASTIIGNGIGYEIGIKHTQYFRTHPQFWKHIEYAVHFFRDHGKKSIFLGQFIGLVRHALPLAAGILGMSRFAFHKINILAILLWATVYLAIGYGFGSYVVVNASKFVLWLQQVGGTLIFGIVVIIVILRWWKERRHAQKCAQEFPSS